jgi:hypothetical protein
LICSGPDVTRLVEQILPRLTEKQRLVIQMAFFYFAHTPPGAVQHPHAPAAAGNRGGICELGEPLSNGGPTFE